MKIQIYLPRHPLLNFIMSLDTSLYPQTPMVSLTSLISGLYLMLDDSRLPVLTQAPTSVFLYSVYFLDIDGSKPAASSSTINIPHRVSQMSDTTMSSGQASPHPLYSVPHKQKSGNRGSAPAKFPKPVIAPPNPQSTGSDSEYLRALHLIITISTTLFLAWGCT